MKKVLTENEICLLADEYRKSQFNKLVSAGESAFYSLSAELYGESFYYDPSMSPEEVEKECSREPELDELPHVNPRMATSDYLEQLKANSVTVAKELAYFNYKRISQTVNRVFAQLSCIEWDEAKAKFIYSSFLKAEIQAIEEYKKAMASSESGHISKLQTIGYEKLFESKSSKTASRAPKAPKRKHMDKRTNELHEIIEQLLLKMGIDTPTRKLWSNLPTHHELIQQVTKKEILWRTSRGHERSMKLRTFDNVVSKIRAKLSSA